MAKKLYFPPASADLSRCWIVEDEVGLRWLVPDHPRGWQLRKPCTGNETLKQAPDCILRELGVDE